VVNWVWYPQLLASPAARRITALWAAIPTRFAFSGKIPAKKGLISLERAQKSGFCPTFSKIRPQKTAISHQRAKFDKIAPQIAAIALTGLAASDPR